MKKTSKNIQNFICEDCNFTCCKKGDWNRHLLRPKHINCEKGYKMIQNDIKKTSKNIILNNCECGNVYKYTSGLWRHKKICNYKEIEKDEEPNEKLVEYLIKENSELKKDNNELKIMIIDACKNMNSITNTNTNTHSNNKTFNLQFFLNETCKDAMNIMDFVDSVKLQMSDLEKMGEFGFVNSISNIIVKNLNSLDETKRPVHCTDTKRETLYVKDEDKWEKEEHENIKLRKAIKKLAHRNSKQLLDFRSKHPDCVKSESKYSDQYNKMVIEAYGGKEDDYDNETKIIKKISKEVTIQK